MKNRVVEIDDNVVALERLSINVRNNLREVSKEQNAQNVSITLNSTTKCRNITIEDGKYRVRIGGNIITKCLLKIKKLLCWKV